MYESIKEAGIHIRLFDNILKFDLNFDHARRGYQTLKKVIYIINIFKYFPVRGS